MGVYTIHLKGPAEDVAVWESAIFVREGFSWAAFLFGPFWMIRHRCWIALLVWVAVQAAVLGLLVALPLGRTGLAALEILIALFVGLEAGQIRCGALRREGFRTVGVAAGERADAERRFFAARHAPQSAPEVRSPTAGPRSTPDMVGLFPISGGARS